MRHRRVLAPINTIKHYVHLPTGSIAAGAILNHVVVSGVTVATAGANAFDVEEGAVIKAVHIELWIINNGTETQTSQFEVIIEKLSTGNPLMSFAQSSSLGAYPNKKNILYTTQGILGAAVSGSPLPILKFWVLIPKGKQRFGLGDRLVVNIASFGAPTMQRCGLSTYKEYK